MTCKDCIHNDVCRGVYLAIQDNTKLTLKEFQILCEKEDFDNQDIALYDCLFFQDRSRFVELQTAHWIRHSPDKNIMRGFHKQGIGRGMGENSIFWTCSNCGNWGVLSYKYCPFCSAKIEKAEQALKEREKDE